jgi:pantoate--beta-alanine ligase
MARLVEDWRRRGRKVGLVPTMGALHEGHVSLVRAAHRRCDRVITTIFVNPTQFGPAEDLDRYPRTPAADRRMLEASGCDVLFAPTAAEIYPPGFDTWIEPGRLARILEGATRPGHFRGVATVCHRLFTICRPHEAFFGAKDFQQTVVLKQMCRDLGLDLKLKVLPTMRDSDGLALSSRNRYLTDRERRVALALPRALEAAADRLASGRATPAAAAQTGRRALALVRGLRLDYFVVCQADTLHEPAPHGRDVVILAAVWVGKTRLIDNRRVRLNS